MNLGCNGKGVPTRRKEPSDGGIGILPIGHWLEANATPIAVVP
jgi:hypothetical protein